MTTKMKRIHIILALALLLPACNRAVAPEVPEGGLIRVGGVEAEVELTKAVDAESIDWLSGLLKEGIDITYGLDKDHTASRLARLTLLDEPQDGDPYSFLYQDVQIPVPGRWMGNGAHFFEGQYVPAELEAGSAMTTLLTDRDGEYFSSNINLISLLIGGEAVECTEADDTYTVRVVITEGENAEYVRSYLCTVDKDTLAIRSLEEEDGFYSCTVEYGGDPIPFAGVLEKAMQKTRTLTYHLTIGGEDMDRVYKVPSDWPFSLGVYEMTFWKDAAHTAETENLVPADGKDYEFWVTEGTGTAQSGSLPFTLADIESANYITALLRKHGQIFARSTRETGSTETQFFLYDGTIIRMEILRNDGAAPIQQGTIGDEAYFEIDLDGNVRTSIYLSDMSDAPLADFTDTEGEYYGRNYQLLWYLLDSTLAPVSETADTITFSATSPYYETEDGPAVCVYTVDRNSLTLLSGDEPGGRLEVTAGANAAPFMSAFAAAMADSRTVTCHFTSYGETKDIVCRIPSAWDVNLIMTGTALSEEPQYYADADWTKPVDPVIPAYSGDIEIWATCVQG